jgi:hypothetical protein
MRWDVLYSLPVISQIILLKDTFSSEGNESKSHKTSEQKMRVPIFFVSVFVDDRHHPRRRDILFPPTPLSSGDVDLSLQTAV